MIRIGSLPGFILLISSACSLKFEVVTQRTALERQVLGSLAEIDEQYVLSTSVRGGSKTIDGTGTSPWKQTAIDAKQNQAFNRDDIDELKVAGVIGEAMDGRISVLPKEIRNTEADDEKLMNFAEVMVAEENHDRDQIIERLKLQTPELKTSTDAQIRKTYGTAMIDSSPSGTWYQGANGKWIQK